MSLEEKSREFPTDIHQPDPLLTPAQRERQQQAAALVLEWAREEDGYDEEIWPLLEQELER